MEKRDIVLLFDGIGEAINEKVLEKDSEISLMYQLKLEEYKTFIVDVLKPYEKRYGREEVIYDWINKYIYDYCMFFKWKKYMHIKCILPYSMGLTTATACVGGISFEDGIRIIVSSFFYTKEVEQDEMKMLMVVGYDKEELKRLIREKCENDTVYEAADIGENYVLLSGTGKSINILKPILIDGGALKVNEIPTPIAYHTRFAKNNIDMYKDVVNSVKVNDIKISICSLYSNKYLTTASELKNEIILNLYSKMNVTSCIEKIKKDGYMTFFEIGASKALYKIYRRMDDDIKILKTLE